MVEVIFLLVAVAVLGFIIKERLEEKALNEFFDRAMAVYESDKDDLIEFDGDEELGWYDWAEWSTCDLCDELVLEGEAIVRILTDDDNPQDAYIACEYCLNPELKD